MTQVIPMLVNAIDFRAYAKPYQFRKIAQVLAREIGERRRRDGNLHRSNDTVSYLLISTKLVDN
jgi:hypothetical protein